jgi:hypothetical protein
MTNKRTKALGLAASLAAIPFLLPTVAGAEAGPGSVGSSHDPESYPPLPGECAGGHLWWQWTDAPDAQVLSASNPFIVLPDMYIGAGHVTITEAITWDARPDEKPEPQPELVPAEAGQEEQLQGGEQIREGDGPDPELYEKMRVEFYKGGELIGASPFHTPDLPDDAPYAWSKSWLGELDLYEDADTVVLKHASGFMKTDGAENAFLPKAVCIQVTPFEVPTTTQPPTTQPPATQPPATTPTDVAPTEVLDESVSVEAEELAFTGNDSARNVAVGAGLLGVGVALLGMSRRRQHA